MSLSAKQYFEILRQIDCNNCKFYHPDTGYCEKVCYQRKPYDDVCKFFVFCDEGLEDWYGLTRADVAEFNKIYRKEQNNG